MRLGRCRRCGLSLCIRTPISRTAVNPPSSRPAAHCVRNLCTEGTGHAGDAGTIHLTRTSGWPCDSQRRLAPVRRPRNEVLLKNNKPNTVLMRKPYVSSTAPDASTLSCSLPPRLVEGENRRFRRLPFVLVIERVNWWTWSISGIEEWTKLLRLSSLGSASLLYHDSISGPSLPANGQHGGTAS